MYRFFFTSGFEGWAGATSTANKILGQLGFEGSSAHAPDVAWAQVCQKEALVDATTENPGQGWKMACHGTALQLPRT